MATRIDLLAGVSAGGSNAYVCIRTWGYDPFEGWSPTSTW